jgi:hypothetical protein
LPTNRGRYRSDELGYLSLDVIKVIQGLCNSAQALLYVPDVLSESHRDGNKAVPYCCDYSVPMHRVERRFSQLIRLHYRAIHETGRWDHISYLFVFWLKNKRKMVFVGG